MGIKTRPRLLRVSRVYVCRLCGCELGTYAAVALHFAFKHPDRGAGCRRLTALGQRIVEEGLVEPRFGLRQQGLEAAFRAIEWEVEAALAEVLARHWGSLAFITPQEVARRLSERCPIRIPPVTPIVAAGLRAWARDGRSVRDARGWVWRPTAARKNVKGVSIVFRRVEPPPPPLLRGEAFA